MGLPKRGNSYCKKRLSPTSTQPLARKQEYALKLLVQVPRVCKHNKYFAQLLGTLWHKMMTVLIANMCKAIQDTNVVLDMTIIPQVVLVPSKMIILDKPVPGYNNVLTTATREMRFGKNDKINFQGFVTKSDSEGDEDLVSSDDEDLTPTNKRPPPLAYPKKSEEPLPKKKTNMDDIFFASLPAILLLLHTFGK